jgi:D-alanyl-D-alanine dipeptidase
MTTCPSDVHYMHLVDHARRHIEETYRRPAGDRLLRAAGGRVLLVSGYRSGEHQRRLWEQALQRHGDAHAARKWVAPPGRSMHERGLAVDLGGDLGLAVRLVKRMGLPLHRPLPHEPWHFELEGSRG